MAEIVNLRQVRKRKRRGEETEAAAKNRVAYGRPAAEKAKTAQLRGIEEKRLDGHRRDPRGDGEQ